MCRNCTIRCLSCFMKRMSFLYWKVEDCILRQSHMVWSLSASTAFRRHLNIMRNNPLYCTLRKDIHPPLIFYLIAKQQTRHLQWQVQTNSTDTPAGPCAKQNMVPRQLHRRKHSQNKRALFSGDPNGILSQ